MTKKKENLQLEEAFQRLEKIVERLESGEETLESSMQLFEEGVSLTEICRTKLEEAENRIKTLVKDSAGNLSVEETD